MDYHVWNIVKFWWHFFNIAFRQQSNVNYEKKSYRSQRYDSLQTGNHLPRAPKRQKFEFSLKNKKKSIVGTAMNTYYNYNSLFFCNYTILKFVILFQSLVNRFFYRRLNNIIPVSAFKSNQLTNFKLDIVNITVICLVLSLQFLFSPDGLIEESIGRQTTEIRYIIS